MQCYRIEFEAPTSLTDVRCTQGGKPEVPPGFAWPVCATCQERQVFLLQVDIPDDLGFKPGSHLSMFTCLTHCDPVMPPETPDLPPDYWLVPEKWREYCQYTLWLHSGPGTTLEEETRTVFQPLRLTPAEEKLLEGYPFEAGSRGFKLGGVPSWCQEPEQYRCSCGTPMRPLLQIPEYTCFKRHPESERQTNSIQRDAYMAFLGNEVYIVACSAQCDPRALWPVAQN